MQEEREMIPTTGQQVDCNFNGHSDEQSEELLASRRKFTWSERRLIAGLSTGSLIFGSTNSFLSAFYPGEAEQRGMNQTTIGLTFGVYALAQLASAPLIAKLVPRFGAIRVFHVGMTLTLISTLTFGFLGLTSDDTTFASFCFLMRILEGIGTTACGTAAFTITASRFPRDISQLVGFQETMNGVGQALGPALGGGMYDLGGFSLPFITLGAVILLCLSFNLIVIPPVENRGSSHRAPIMSMFRQVTTSYRMWLCSSTLLIVSFSWTAMDPGLQPYVSATMQMSSSELGLFYLVCTGVYAISAPFLGRWANYSPNPYIQTSLCLNLASLGLLLIPPAPPLQFAASRWFLAVGLILREVCLGGAYIPTFSIMLSSARDQGLPDDVDTQAFISSCWWALNSAGNGLGPPVAGALTDGCGFPLTATVLATVAFLIAAPNMLRAYQILFRKTIVYQELE